MTLENQYVQWADEIPIKFQRRSFEWQVLRMLNYRYRKIRTTTAT